MKEEIKFLNFLQDKLELTSDELAYFLFIDKRTLYNYKVFTVDNLPNKVQEKIILFFQTSDEYGKEDLSMHDVLEILNHAKPEDLQYIRTRFLDTVQVRKRNFIVTNTKELFYKTTIKREVNSLDEFITDLRILMEYSELSKGYIYSLLEIIITKLGSQNDYKFLDYINRYNKGEK